MPADSTSPDCNALITRSCSITERGAIDDTYKGALGDGDVRALSAGMRQTMCILQPCAAENHTRRSCPAALVAFMQVTAESQVVGPIWVQ